MRVLITGTGFIGSYSAAELLNRGDEVVSYGFYEDITSMSNVINLNKIVQVKGDVLDFKSLKDAVVNNSVEAIVHTAAILIAGARENPLNAVKVNVLGTANVLEISRLTGVKKVIYTSSGNVYTMLNPYVEYTPSPDGLVKEDDHTFPGSVYGTTKLSSEYLGLNYHHLYGIDFISLRLPTVYGGWLGKMGLAGVIRDMCKAALTDEAIEVEEYKSEWLHVKDAAYAIALALHVKDTNSKIYNIGTGEINSLAELHSLLKEATKKTLTNIKIKEVPRPIRYPSDISRAKTELGFVPKYDFKTGVLDVFDWVKRYLINKVA